MLHPLNINNMDTNQYKLFLLIEMSSFWGLCLVRLIPGGPCEGYCAPSFGAKQWAGYSGYETVLWVQNSWHGRKQCWGCETAHRIETMQGTQNCMQRFCITCPLLNHPTEYPALFTEKCSTCSRVETEYIIFMYKKGVYHMKFMLSEPLKYCRQNWSLH